MYSQTDARGKTITFTYDLLGRSLTQTTNGPEAPIQFTYDDASVPFSRGRLTKVTTQYVTIFHVITLHFINILQEGVSSFSLCI
nr:RHS repeat domain-containing protein [Leptospira sp. mild_001]